MGVCGWVGVVVDYGGYVGDQCFFCLLWIDLVNMGIDFVGGDNFFFGGNYFC